MIVFIDVYDVVLFYYLHASSRSDCPDLYFCRVYPYVGTCGTLRRLKTRDRVNTRLL